MAAADAAQQLVKANRASQGFGPAVAPGTVAGPLQGRLLHSPQGNEAQSHHCGCVLLTHDLGHSSAQDQGMGRSVLPQQSADNTGVYANNAFPAEHDITRHFGPAFKS